MLLMPMFCHSFLFQSISTQQIPLGIYYLQCSMLSAENTKRKEGRENGKERRKKNKAHSPYSYEVHDLVGDATTYIK